jgi:hypothetical protein
VSVSIRVYVFVCVCVCMCVCVFVHVTQLREFEGGRLLSDPVNGCPVNTAGTAMAGPSDITSPGTELLLKV